MRSTIITVGFFFLLFLGSGFWLVPSLLAQTDPFYKGKSIRVVVGTTIGGFYDRWARLISRHLPNYIPGSPEIIVQKTLGEVMGLRFNIFGREPSRTSMFRELDRREGG